jgi:hypothetical protein
VLQQTECLACQSAEAVAIHRSGPCVPTGDYAQARAAIARYGMQSNAPDICGPTAGEDGGNLRLAVQPKLPWEAEPVARPQTARRARPRARRARMTARPPRVRMRTRKPWVRFLRTTEG